MEDLSLHILDIAENSVAAGAGRIEIRVTEDTKKDELSIEIIDNGRGMDEDTLEKAGDPFFTTKTVRRFGFGLPLLAEAARTAGGAFSIASAKGKGTEVKASFRHSHIDRQPIGDMAQTLITLIMGNPGIDFLYIHRKDGRESRLDTAEIRAQWGDVPPNSLQGLKIIKKILDKINY